jgi:hypothetical protein
MIGKGARRKKVLVWHKCMFSNCKSWAVIVDHVQKSVPNNPAVRVWNPVRLPGVYSSVKSLQRLRLESRNRNNTE